MIVILDYDMGNVGSIQNMLKKIMVDSIISNDYAVIESADKLILPGVGKFDTGMEQLRKFGLIEAIHRHVYEKGKPILGICLGMQLLGRKSEEGMLPGLSLIPFDTIRFLFGMKILKPHMGWDYVKILQINDPIADGLSDENAIILFTLTMPTVMTPKRMPLCPVNTVMNLQLR